MVRLLTPAAARNWIDLASVKLLMEESGSERDAILERLIRDASAKLEGRAGFCPGRQRYEESVKGCGMQSFYLTHRPVDAGSLTVTVNGETVTDWVLQDPSMGLLWRQWGWPYSVDGNLNIVVTYFAGFLMPGQVDDWTAETAVEVGEWVRPGSPSILRYECTAAGTTAASAPTWSDEAGEETTDGSAAWTAREVEELPITCEDGAYATVLMLDAARDRPAGLASWEVEGASESFFATQTAADLPPGVILMVDRFRAEYGPRGFA